MRKLNLPFLIGLLALGTATAAGVHFRHSYQIRRNASALLERAHTAEAANDLGKAEEELSRYLSIIPKDAGAWERYARLLDRKTPVGSDRSQVYLVLERALRDNPDDVKLERRCAEVGLELGRFSDARRHLRVLLDQAPKDADGKPADAGLEDLLGQCDQGESKASGAEDWFRKAVAHDPGRVETYDRLARLLRADAQSQVKSDRLIEEMVKANPKSALAHVYRYRYNHDFGLTVDKNDVARALELGPDEADVLITAADFAREGNDLASARKHVEHGLQMHPATPVFYRMSAGLELAENHPDLAEAVLRRGITAAPSDVELKILLTEALISQEKVDGDDGAASWIERLRKLGLADGYAYSLEARVAMVKQKWPQAISKFELARSLLAADPAIVSGINLLLAECYSRSGEREKQVAALQRAASGERTAAVAGPLLAQTLESEGRLDEAIKLYTSLLERRPESRLDLVRLLIQKNLRLPEPQRHWEEVEQRLREAEKALPLEVEDLALLRADMLRFQGRFDAAGTYLEKAIQQQPNSVRVRTALASLLQVRDDMAGAAKTLDRAEKDLGMSARLLAARAAYWTKMGGTDSKKALDRLAELCTSLPAEQQPLALNELATSFYRLGEPVRAAQFWSQLSKLEPENLDVLRRLADLALGANDRPSLEVTLKRFKELEGEHGTIGRYYEAAFQIGEASRGDPLTAGSAIQKAKSLVEQILELRVDWWGGLVLRARLAELAGKPEDAVRDYLQAIDMGAMQPELAHRTVKLLYQLKRIDQIDQFVQKLAERGMALDELKLATVVNALGREDFDRAVTVAREVIPETSNNYFDLLFLSRVLLAAGHTAAAEKPLNRAMALAPAVSEVWVNEVQYLVEASRRGEVAQILEQAARALPNDQVAKTLGLCQTIAGNYDEAARLFESDLEAHPDDSMTLRLAAEFYIKVLKLDKAAPLIAKLLDPRTGASPADVAWANRSRGLMKIRSGDQRQIDEALVLIDQNLKINPSSFDDQRARAVLLTAKPKRRDEAIRALEALEKVRLLSQEDRFLLAQMYYANRDWPVYQDQMLRLLKERKTEPEHLANFVNWLIERGEFEQAERRLQGFKPADPAGSLVVLEVRARLLRAKKSDSELLKLLSDYSREHDDQIGPVGVLFERYGYLKEAEQAYRAFVKRNVNEPLSVLALVRFLGRQSRAEEAFSLCEQAWKTCPPEPVAAASILVLMNEKNINEERRHRVGSWLEDALRRQPNSIQLRLNLATLRSMQLRYDQTEALYREVLHSSPDNLEALNNLAWLLSFRNGDGEEPLRLINQAIEIAGPSASLLDTRAAVYLRLGRTEAAIQDLGEAIAINPQEAIFHLHLSRAYQSAKKIDEARKAWKKAEELGMKPQFVDPLEQELIEKLRKELASLNAQRSSMRAPHLNIEFSGGRNVRIQWHDPIRQDARAFQAIHLASTATSDAPPALMLPQETVCTLEGTQGEAVPGSLYSAQRPAAGCGRRPSVFRHGTVNNVTPSPTPAVVDGGWGRLNQEQGRR